ncbi:chemotaxis protein MotB [Pseudomonas sp. ok272]|uniref:OmpA family protein n=1 Tax=unclassified Pseudomonas TaxID=196821 RepID=UPI0008B7623F|nr:MULTISPECIES: OmpA family protein [unclassified Pseudomonas]SEM63062.1 chemotaxis protein MotB [Pseudomonas sp. ok272]SFM47020.1 chemotaxis protein MotB [Pseudomonas sp. ok602]
MRKRGDTGHEVIIRRRAKKSSHDEHGGAWKVAFADFTLAMMALFMVLWIVNPKTDERPITSADRLANPMVDGGAGVFDNSSRVPTQLDGVPLRANPEVENSPISETREQTRDSAIATNGKQHVNSPAEMKQLVALLDALAKETDALTNLEVQVVPQGLRILIKDDQQRFMFQRGSATLTAHFQRVLSGLAGVLAKVDNKLIISGHTDATPYKHKAGYNNWNLSGDRALRARNVMVDAGLPAAGVLQVSAQADVMPLRADEPQHGANRRIEILLLTSQAESLYRELFGEHNGRADYSVQGSEYVNPQAPTPAPPVQAL